MNQQLTAKKKESGSQNNQQYSTGKQILDPQRLLRTMSRMVTF